jgi:hypothetical protein
MLQCLQLDIIQRPVYLGSPLEGRMHDWAMDTCLSEIGPTS